jgi:hypothetical protein
MNYDCEIITRMTYDKSDDFMKNLFEVQNRSFAIKKQIKNTKNYIILCPTIADDYDNLRQITVDYIKYCNVNRKQVFLSRCYSSRSSFHDKIKILNEIWNSHDISTPLCYREKPNQVGDPCFETSLLFTIFAPNLTTNKIVGDIWLSHVELCDIELYKGAVERSTMIDYKYQSKGIGQTAIKALYGLIIEKWCGKTVTLINFNKKEMSNTIFTGVFSCVDYRNYKSLGNNIKSGNNIIGICEIDKNMIMFRASKDTLIYTLTSELKTIVMLLININDIYYKTALQSYQEFIKNNTRDENNNNNYC